MMRVVHLIDQSSPQATATTLALLDTTVKRVEGVDSQVLLLGGRALRDEARRVGLCDARCVGVPYGRAVHGWAAVRRQVGAMGKFDVVHCWSIGTLSLAAMMWRQGPRVMTMTVEPSVKAVHWLSTLTGIAPGRTVFLPISQTISRQLRSGGVAESAVHVVRPAIDMGRVVKRQREVLRQGWGVESDDEVVVALLCDPPTATDAIGPTMAVSLAADSSGAGAKKKSMRLLMHPDQRHRGRAVTMMRRLGHVQRVLIDQRVGRPWELLAGCDMAICCGAGPGAGGLSLRWAMAGNVPIVAQATYANSEVVEADHTALLSRTDQPRLLAGRIGQLLADRNLAWRLRDTARHEAYSYFRVHDYCTAMRTVYEQVVGGEAIEVPAMEVTGGLRFAGRA